MFLEHNVMVLLFPVYKIHDHLDKDVHLVHPALGDQQGQGDKDAVTLG